MPEKEWTELEILTPEPMSDVIGNFCHECGCSGLYIEEEDGGQIRIIAYFPADKAVRSLERLEEYLKNLAEIFPDLPHASVACRPVKSENWAVMWKENFKSMAHRKKPPGNPALDRGRFIGAQRHRDRAC